MKKRLYEKPAMQVVLLKQQPQLLQASVNATMTTEWEEEDI